MVNTGKIFASPASALAICSTILRCVQKNIDISWMRIGGKKKRVWEMTIEVYVVNK